MTRRAIGALGCREKRPLPFLRAVELNERSLLRYGYGCPRKSQSGAFLSSPRPHLVVAHMGCPAFLDATGSWRKVAPTRKGGHLVLFPAFAANPARPLELEHSRIRVSRRDRGPGDEQCTNEPHTRTAAPLINTASFSGTCAVPNRYRGRGGVTDSAEKGQHLVLFSIPAHHLQHIAHLLVSTLTAHLQHRISSRSRAH